METIRILIVDDHPVMRAGLKAVLSLPAEFKIDIVGEAEKVQEALDKAAKLLPNVILMDISLGENENGLEASRRIKEELPDIKTIILTMHEEAMWVAAFVESGAKGYILKTALPEEIFRAIDEVYNGGMYVTPTLFGKMFGKNPCGHLIGSLTLQEIRVVKSIAQGMSSQEIADAMNVAVKTIGRYRENIYTKLGLHGVAELTRFALDNGLL